MHGCCVPSFILFPTSSDATSSKRMAHFSLRYNDRVPYMARGNLSLTPPVLPDPPWVNKKCKTCKTCKATTCGQKKKWRQGHPLACLHIGLYSTVPPIITFPFNSGEHACRAVLAPCGSQVIGQQNNIICNVSGQTILNLILAFNQPASGSLKMYADATHWFKHCFCFAVQGHTKTCTKAQS